MEREPVIKIFLKGFAFMLFGNVLGGIMTLSLAPFISEWYIPYIAVLFTAFLYCSLMFTAGLKDGQNEAKLLRNKRIESIPKSRWIKIGLILAAIMFIPCIILMLGIMNVFTITGEYVFAFRFICGALCPGMYIAGTQNLAVTEFPIAMPIVFMAVYLVLTPLSAALGYKFGYDEKAAKNFMYEP